MNVKNAGRASRIRSRKRHTFFIELFSPPKVLNTCIIRTDMSSFNSFIRYDFSDFSQRYFVFEFKNKSEQNVIFYRNACSKNIAEYLLHIKSIDLLRTRRFFNINSVSL